jgi:hypothetical protein
VLNFYFREQVQSKVEKKRRRAVLYRSDMESRSEVRKEKSNWSRSGERKEKSRSGMRTKKKTWIAGAE